MMIRPGSKLFVLFLLLLGAALLANCGATPTPTPLPPTETPEPVVEPEATAPPDASTPQPSALEVALENIQRREGEVLATVNGEEILWEDYEPTLRQALMSINQQYDINWTDPAMKQRLAQVQNDVLRQTVDRLLMRKLAADQGVTVDAETLQAQIEHEKSSILSSGRYADWETFLQQNGLTEKSFEDVIYDTLLFNALLDAQEVETEGEQIHIAHIVVTDAQQAQEVLDRLEAGEDWDALAAQYSIDEQTKDNGGDLGWFTPEMLSQEVSSAVASLEVGQFAGPLGTQHGYAIVKVLGREVRPLDQRALRQRQRDAVMILLDAEREKATIVYLVDFTADQGGE